jgi:hypothetical protein
MLLNRSSQQIVKHPCVSRVCWRVQRQLLLTLLSAASLMLVSQPLVVSEDASAKPDPAVIFESGVLPVLRERCWKCHAGAEPQNGLRLTARNELFRGGKSGPAVRIAAAESSLLWEKIASNEMPAGGPPLSAEEKGIIRTWINEGARGLNPADEQTSDDVPAAENSDQHLWSFQPPVRPSVPSVQNSQLVRNPVDAFLLAQLEAKGLSYSAEANREQLLRRASFDLTGLPPTPAELKEFLEDTEDLAFERMIDRLLESPQYGERWGRHWLDVAGYADSAGVLSEDRPLPTAFRYRDYVIRAFNSDKPYDRFLLEQIAGDELTDYWVAYETQDRLPDDVVEAITATGFLRCAPDASRPDFTTIKNAAAQYFYPTINDTLQIVSSSAMGLTVQCARCHSHKYDPVPQSEYYRLQSIFMAAFRPDRWVPQMERELAVATASQKKTAAENNVRVDAEVARLRKELAELRTQFRQKLLDERLNSVPDAIRADVQQALARPKEQRNTIEVYLAGKFEALLQPDEAAVDKALPETFADYKHAVEVHNASIAEQERHRMHFDTIRSVYDLPGEVVTPLLRRGDALMPGPPVEPGVISAIAAPVSFQWTRVADDAKTSGRRLAFAKWLTQPHHPLTARVMVNRIWMHHFGEGIVSTPEDFGAMGMPPSHPELLDWLAIEFVERGWSIKQMHRLMMNSGAWRQQSAVDQHAHAKAQSVDPDNRLLWRQRLRRLEAEAVRDAVLRVTGLLDMSQFGSPVPVARRADGEVTVADGANDRRRSIYIQVLRGNPLTMLQAFDQPVMETNCIRRSRSTVSTQALTLLNSDTMQTAADAMSEQLLKDQTLNAADLQSVCTRAVRAAYGRMADSEEIAAMCAFIETQRSVYLSNGKVDPSALHMAVADLCHMLLSSNEFVYVD